MKRFTSIILLILSFSCKKDDEGTVICTQNYVYGLNVTLKNSVTDDIITEGVVVLAKDGTYEEQLVLVEMANVFIGAGERAGNYIIQVTSDDYLDFISDTIIVDENECHVFPKSIEIYLQPI